jgi:hypothetical protein
MKRDALMLGLLVGGAIIAGSLASRRVRRHLSEIPGRMMGWMMEHMPEQ